jgi:UDP-N-acetylglucosamine:LPS N-acetylglucosamine transferase
LLIPIPWASHNEQFKNAKMAKDLGIAEILEQENISGEILMKKIKSCLSNLDSYKLKDENVLKILLNDSANLIADEVIKVYKKSKK